MLKSSRLLLIGLAAAAMAGCAMHEATNLTPRKLPREADNLYHFEISWKTARRGVNTTNVQAYVMVGENMYPMKPVPLTDTRFEASVPLPPGKTYIPYRYRFDYDYPGLGYTYKNSDLSPSYRLIVPADAAAPITTDQPK